MNVIKYKNSGLPVDKETLPSHFQTVRFQTHEMKNFIYAIGYFNANEGLFYELNGEKISFANVYQWEPLSETLEIQEIKIKDLIERNEFLEKEINQVIEKKNSVMNDLISKKEGQISELFNIIDFKDQQLTHLSNRLFSLKQKIRNLLKGE